MNFNSLAFLIYLPIVVGGYWLLPHRARKVWLLAASYFFYGYWNPAFIFLLLFSTAVDYLCSVGMDRHRGKPLVMKLLMMTSVMMNLGLLFSFKYFDFFAENINLLSAALGWSYRVPQLGLILPVGISFYTFQTMSYTIDVYRGDVPAEKDPIAFALFVTYFPQLVAGPIESVSNLLPQLKKEHTFSREDFTAGVRILLCGFFRKCVVADYCGIHVNAVFADLGSANALAIALAGSLFCIQMYCDFAGYSEIATGCARMMGVRLMRNFDRPYLSQSYTEFFRRWHISLNRWFTSYVYIPLGGSRKGVLRKNLNIIIVFALCGLWHGARWTYVLWGLYAAMWLCIENALDIKKRFGPRWQTPLGRLTRRTYMFLIFIPAALLFRAESLQQVGVIFSRLFTEVGFGEQYVADSFRSLSMNGLTMAQILLSIICMARIYTLTENDLIVSSEGTRRGQRTAGYALLLLVIALGWIALLATDAAAGFAYFQF
ncbi:MAG: MBOAT family protein [Clostridia bacterium]|nr:MBOAT family protein [Clostridia bacterium]